MIDASINSYTHPAAKDAFLRDLQINVPTGRVTCLLGLSGVGKTTLLYVLLGLAPGRVDGTVVFRYNNESFSPRDARRRGLVGILTQGAPLVPWLSVVNNLRLPSRLNKSLSYPTDDDIDFALQNTGLTSQVLKARPHELSFGMAQRVAFARALIFNPPFLLLDEMFTGLDSASRELLAQAIRLHLSRSRSTCLMITHDAEQALELSSDLLYLTPRRALEQLRNPDRAYVHRRMVADLPTPTTAATANLEGVAS